jgi:hypothetical protein
MATPTALGQIPSKWRKSKDWEILKLCRDYYKISNDQFEDCILEGQEIIDMYHNRQYTQAQLAELKSRGQPAETFNVIKMMTNAIVGFLETIVTTVTVEPRYPGSAITASLMNDVVQFILDKEEFRRINKFAKIDGLLTGLMCVYEDVADTGEKDEFGRPIYSVRLEHVPSWQVRIDPKSQREDYQDARFIHHFKWMPESEVKKRWPQKWKELTEYYNFLEDHQADYARQYRDGYDIGKYKQYDNYLIVKTVLEYKGKIYSVIWSDEVILEKKEITYKNVRFPYRILKLSKSDKAEYYGPFRDIAETQRAINQALLQIQLLVNTSKAFIEEGAVEDIDEFRDLFNRVNAVIPVVSLQGVKVEDVSRDVMAQYAIIDNALTRIKMILGVNDSFLGQAYASDSGRKVQIQQMSAASQMTMITDAMQAFIKLVGEDIVGLVKEYYRGHQILKVADPLNAFHYTEINAPLLIPTAMDPVSGEPIMEPVIVPELDPETAEPLRDENGNIIMVPLNDPDTDIEFADVDIRVLATRADNADERNQLLFETFTNGPMGSILMNLNPSGTLRVLAMQVSEYGTKHSIEIAQILMQTAMMIDQGQIDPATALRGLGSDVQKVLGASLGGQTGNVQNMPRTGQQPGNAGSIPKPGKEGGSPGNAMQLGGN